ncbi:hypothetical protein [uncultured Aquimarina sp.]|uniref:hypothetical protein n=1 Tax=uncultured Aquimarina sp. TaxID=575652 RepID=UPI00262499C3|nr:hypothetical protein [uncultured Aquimarina sp.]
MKGREQSKFMSLCLSEGIVIYPIVYARKRYKIVIETRGIPKEGKEIYPQDPEVDKKTKERKPSVYEKIHELYEEIAQNIKRKINNKNQALI